MAEYEALVNVLLLASKVKPGMIKVLTDSQLVASQVGGEYIVKDPKMIDYNKLVQKVTDGIPEIWAHQFN